MRKQVRRNRRARISRTITTNQSAFIKETVQFKPILSNTAYSFSFQLNDFLRASALAPNFKWYKPVKVEWTMTPLYNTFQDGVGGTEVSQPYIYSMMNRTQDSKITTIYDLQAMGAKPRKFNSVSKLAYKPNWCSPGLLYYVNSQGALVRQQHQGLKANYEYLACPNDAIGVINQPQYLVPINPVQPPIPNEGETAIATNDVVFNGHSIYIQQLNDTGEGQYIAQVVCTVSWAFKDPNNSFLEGEDSEQLKLSVDRPTVVLTAGA